MKRRQPRVSIGLPVFNGESYLAQALESILAQTYGDFELIISDNASTDSTQDICVSYASRDSRLRYVRTERNLGAAANFNRVFHLAGGEYFKWAAHDDHLAAEYLDRCVAVLDSEDSVVLCQSGTRVIDEQGAFVEDYDVELRVGSPIPSERFYDLTWVSHRCYLVFGVIRRNVLSQTGLIGNYAAADRVLLTKLALLGRFSELSDRLFYSRQHSGQYTGNIGAREAQNAWFDTEGTRALPLAKWRIMLGYWRAIAGSPIPRTEALRCHWHMCKWATRNTRTLMRELAQTARARQTRWHGSCPSRRS